jgi:hypothetical protein
MMPTQASRSVTKKGASPSRKVIALTLHLSRLAEVAFKNA